MTAETIERQSAELTLPQRAAAALGTAKHELELRALVKTSAAITEIKNLDGRTEAHSALMRLVKARTTITGVGKLAREDATAFTKAVLAEERRLIAITSDEEERLQALRDEWDAARQAERDAAIAAERARVNAIQERIENIRSAPIRHVSSDSEKLKTAIEFYSVLPIRESEYAEFAPEAGLVREQTLAKLESLLSIVVATEAEAARKLAERKAEDERRAAEATLLLQQRAELDRLAAEQKAAADAEAARVKAERDAAQAELKAAQDKFNAEQAAQRAETARQQAEAQKIIDDAARVRREELDAADAKRAHEEQVQRQEEVERARLQAEADKMLADHHSADMLAAEDPIETNSARLCIAALQFAHGYLIGRHNDSAQVQADIEQALIAAGEPFNVEGVL